MFQYFLPKNANQFKVVNSKVMLGLLIFSTIFCLINSLVEHGDDTPFLLIGLFDLFLIFLLYRTKSITLIGNLYLLIWCIVLSNMSLKTGGIYSMDSLSLIFAPLIAYCLIGKKSGNLWLVYFLGFSLFLWNIASDPTQDFRFKEARSSFDRHYYLAGHLMFITLFTSIFYLFYHHYKQLIQQLRIKQEELNQSLLLLQQQSTLLEQSKKELQKSNVELEEYANATSHDLKQPIRNVHSFATLLQKHLTKQDKLDNRSKEMLGFITEGSTRMLNLITDLLDFAKLKTEQERVFQEEDLNKIVKSALFTLHSRIEKTGTTVNVNTLPQTWIIPVKLGQVFQNLLSNAIKFRKKETPLVIEISAIENEASITISIQDNGIGIEKQFQEKIFTPFKKLHSQQEYKGSGIGLATCKHIIGLHLGELWVESEFGKGATFYFTISKLLNVPNVKEGRMVLEESELN